VFTTHSPNSGAGACHLVAQFAQEAKRPVLRKSGDIKSKKASPQQPRRCSHSPPHCRESTECRWAASPAQGPGRTPGGEWQGSSGWGRPKARQLASLFSVPDRAQATSLGISRTGGRLFRVLPGYSLQVVLVRPGSSASRTQQGPPVIVANAGIAASSAEKSAHFRRLGCFVHAGEGLASRKNMDCELLHKSSSQGGNLAKGGRCCSAGGAQGHRSVE
jgi:hypothetical protein